MGTNEEQKLLELWREFQFKTREEKLMIKKMMTEEELLKFSRLDICNKYKIPLGKFGWVIREDENGCQHISRIER